MLLRHVDNLRSFTIGHNQWKTPVETPYFDYHLPKELIAQIPTPKRDESRLMVLDRNRGSILHRRFYEIADFLESGDVLVVNDTKVIPARIFGKDTKTREVLLIKEVEPLTWKTLIKPHRGLRLGEELVFDSIKGRVIKRTEEGMYIIQFSSPPPIDEIGYAPLPPYIKRDYKRTNLHRYDKTRYQTIYAKDPGAIAAPTAGMHFTEELLEKIKGKGVVIAPITLHVGIGTFRPVRSLYVEDHKMHPEWFYIPEETTGAIKNAKRIIAVGTTTVRALETCIKGSGYTELFIYPPYRFKVVDALITNFHLPKSTLLMLVSAFCGREFIMKAYEEAIRQGYRFYSYGDAMLIL